MWRRDSIRLYNTIKINNENHRYLHIQKVINKKPHRGNLISYYIFYAHYNYYNDSSDTDIDDVVHYRDEYNE